ncbi:MAG: hypothetical protein VZS44_09375 [Bacilli bacterium]|nr:hypothetical protein [Bacilli bacterium]
MKIEDMKKLMGNTPIREMKYTTKNIRELLCNGIYKEYHFYVLNLGNHPTAYVEIPKTSKLFGKHYDDIDILVHGGLTYSDDELRTSENTKMTNSWFIGWDYAHAGDYCAYMEDMKEWGLDSINSFGNKKWTSEEIINHCISVIDQIIEGEENEI